MPCGTYARNDAGVKARIPYAATAASRLATIGRDRLREKLCGQFALTAHTAQADRPAEASSARRCPHSCTRMPLRGLRPQCGSTCVLLFQRVRDDYSASGVMSLSFGRGRLALRFPGLSPGRVPLQRPGALKLLGPAA
jgi:hypothetical protein